MFTITCVLFIVPDPLLLCLCGKPLLYILWECRVARFSFHQPSFLKGGQKYFSQHFFQSQSVLVILQRTRSCQWTCAGHLRAGHNNHVSFWVHWQVCSAAGWFLKVARPVHVLWVMSQQGIHVITLNTVVKVLPLLEVPCMISRTILNSACAGVISVAADHFGIGLCFQLFLLCFQLLIAQLAV